MAIGTLIAVSAIASLISGIIGAINQASTNSANKQMQSDANQANKDIVAMTNQAQSAEAEKNRQFQLMMSNTAHQREVADLQAAGLNPWLSVSGAGATSMSGATANLNSANMQASRNASLGDLGLSQVASIFQSMAMMKALDARAGVLADAKTNSAEIYANARSNNRMPSNTSDMSSARKVLQKEISDKELKRILYEIKH